ncbi:MAG: DNA polymerase III subunit alpha [Planctomycetota bacterium]
MDGFVHLHVHSHYSLLDGANRIGELVKTAAGMGMKALALTDHGNLFGAVEFYKAAKDAGIKPILGMEAYISPTSRTDRSMGNIQTASYHMLLLAMNAKGWSNLIKLSSRAYLEGFYYRPRIDRELLRELGEGLICGSACLGGEIPSALLSGQPDKAERIAREYIEIFGRERFFIEVQVNGLADQEKVNPLLMALADKLGVGVVGTNDVHFLRRSDKKAHEVLTCISTGKTMADGGAMVYPPELYLKDIAEMRSALAHLGAAADTTLAIADMCDLKLDFQEHLPVFPTPAGTSADEHLAALSRAGLLRRFKGKTPPNEYYERLDRELKVIADKGYSSYFLIVGDFVEYARRNNIPASARGSGVATLIGYVLDVTDVDPLRYGLLFERFTDPQRKEAPDIDIDMCQEGRAKVIQYVREKYGHVAQIITYGTLKARAVIRDVARVMDIPLTEADKIAKLVPEQLKMTLEKALEAEPALAKLYSQDPKIRELIDYGKRLEGLARHAGVHAAGVIIAQKPLEELVPLCKQTDREDAITQWDGPTCDKVGLMKMDFLGLRTLTVLQRARDLVRQRSGKDIVPAELPLDDPQVYDLFQRGSTDGVFQFESEGMKGVLMQIRPTCIEDLIAANAMYRPGPMELIPAYAARKNGRESVPPVHALVDDILAETYGIMCYQEQVMLVLNRLGKLPLNRALTLIKAISKKREDVIASEWPNFLAGAKENGIADADARQLFDLILKFAGYGFNKAHSTGYAILAYQTAYFKAHYGREFLAATLTFECGDQDKVVQYMAEGGRMGVTIAPPDINTCDSDFTVDGDRVRFGLAAVKGVGDKAVGEIMAARQGAGRFENLYHFCEHVDLRSVNRSTIEALIKCGAFDALGAHRAAMSAVLDRAIEQGQTAASDRKSGQMSLLSLFGGDEPGARPVEFPNVEPWSQAQLLAAEKETLGFYITSHPLAQYGREIDGLTVPTGFALGRPAGFTGQQIGVGCMIVAQRQMMTKKNDRMAVLTLEDLTGKCDGVVFPETYKKIQAHLVVDTMVYVIGKASERNGRPQVEVEDVIPLDQAVAERTGTLILRLPAGDRKALLARVQTLLQSHKGSCPVYFELVPAGRDDVTVVVRAGEAWSVAPCRTLLDDLTTLLGDQSKLVLRARRLPAPEARRRGPWTKNGNGSPASQEASPAVTRFN